MSSSVISLYSCDFYKMEIHRLIKAFTVFKLVNLRSCVQYLYCAWFLDGGTSKLVSGSTGIVKFELYKSGDVNSGFKEENYIVKAFSIILSINDLSSFYGVLYK